LLHQVGISNYFISETYKALFLWTVSSLSVSYIYKLSSASGNDVADSGETRLQITPVSSEVLPATDGGVRQTKCDVIYLLTAIGLTHGGSSTVHTYTQTVHRTTRCNTIHRTEHT